MEEEQNSINSPISYQLDRKTIQYHTIFQEIDQIQQHHSHFHRKSISTLFINQHLITLISIGKDEYNNYSSYREITINNEENIQIES